MVRAASTAHAAPPPGAREFRDGLGRSAGGAALGAAAPGGGPAGLIVTSRASVPLAPPLVSFSPSRRSLTWSRMRRTGGFGVNVLGEHHAPFAVHATPAGAPRFAGLDWEPGRLGTPLLADALASFECYIVGEHAAGDHWIVVGRVANLRVSMPGGNPLVFFEAGFRGLRA